MAVFFPTLNALPFSSSAVGHRACSSVLKRPIRIHYRTKCSTGHQEDYYSSTNKQTASPTTINPLAKSKAALLISTEDEPEPIGRKTILLSNINVVEKRPNSEGRKWNFLDMTIASAIVVFHVLSVFAPFAFNWEAFWVAFGLYVVTGLGITLSYHRNLAHRSFKMPKWLEYFFAYCGVQGGQMDPIFWVSVHRYHHQYCDSERDPHSPITEGFWFSHIFWHLDNDYKARKCGEQTNVEDLMKQPYYKFLQKTYFAHLIGLGIVLYWLGGFPFLVWGMGVRLVWVYHITALINSGCHLWGTRAWNTTNFSRNNWWLGIIALGEGWHNNHHAFEYSARIGLEWWQLDLGWYVIRFLQAVGLATNVKLPSDTQKKRMAFP